MCISCLLEFLWASSIFRPLGFLSFMSVGFLSLSPVSILQDFVGFLHLGHASFSHPSPACISRHVWTLTLYIYGNILAFVWAYALIPFASNHVFNCFLQTNNSHVRAPNRILISWLYIQITKKQYHAN